MKIDSKEKKLFHVGLNKFQIMRALEIIKEECENGRGCYGMQIEGKSLEEFDNELLEVFERTLGND